LAVGVAFLDLLDGPDRSAFATFVSRLSAELGTEVQYFATHRVLEAHAWGRAVGGELRRAYEYVGESGETVIDVGSLSAEEQELGLNFSNPNRTGAGGTDEFDESEARWPDEESVIALADRWSIGPARLEENPLEVPEGLVGEIDLSPFAPAQPSASLFRIWDWLRARFRRRLSRTASTQSTVDSYFGSYKRTLKAAASRAIDEAKRREAAGAPPPSCPFKVGEKVRTTHRRGGVIVGFTDDTIYAKFPDGVVLGMLSFAHDFSLENDNPD
jgi:hypothetical protein